MLMGLIHQFDIISHLDAAACIISTAQQANPKVIGHREPLRAQFTRSSILETVYSTPFATGTLSRKPLVSSSTLSKRLREDVVDLADPAIYRFIIELA